MPEKEFICIVCPNSCRLKVRENGGEPEVTGAGCARGIEHGKQEYSSPMRMLTTTIAVKDGIHPRLSVVSDGEIPKEKISECLEYLYGIEVKAPVKAGEAVATDLCGTGVNILASRSMKRRE